METPKFNNKLTVKIARDYLNFISNEPPKTSKKNKKTEDPKRFLLYRKELVQNYFSPEEICSMVDDVREKIRQSTSFYYAVREVVLPKIRTKRWVDIGKIISLISVLLHVFKDSAYKEYIEQSEAEIVTNLRTNEKEEEFVILLESLKNNYFFDQEIGNEMNSSENERYFEQAWGVFEKKETQDMPEEEKRKLYEYLYEKYAK